MYYITFALFGTDDTAELIAPADKVGSECTRLESMGFTIVRVYPAS